MSEYSEEAGALSSRDCTQNNIGLDNSINAADNSIIGKVKSRVSSILPNRISKWFTTTATKVNNEHSLNGSFGANTLSKRRRHLEPDDDEDDDIEDYEEDLQYPQETEECRYQRSDRRDEDNSEYEDGDDDNGDEEEEEELNTENNMIQSTTPMRDTNISIAHIIRQPPAKRSRLEIENTTERGSPLVTPCQPLVASTPAISNPHSRNVNSDTTCRSSYHRFTNEKINCRQTIKNSTYDFTTAKSHLNANLINASTPLGTFTNQSGALNHSEISSRKSLNIQPSASSNIQRERLSVSTLHLKRQPLSSVKTDSPLNAAKRPSMAIEESLCSSIMSEVKGNEQQRMNFNDNSQLKELNSMGSKRQKLVNGTPASTNKTMDITKPIVLDTASESGESENGSSRNVTEIEIEGSCEQLNQLPRKTGLFNMTATTSSRHGSRTSSFGNDLNFFSHLEGRKSLFAGNNTRSAAPDNSLNNSTLSLSSLNRRQFNASIYGSTSALSDSRLLNTFSPFYKGTTAYGGAAAYNKNGRDVSTSAVRIPPTIVRPTSSLSNLCSSSNSLNIVTGKGQRPDNSTISSTAKRILDLITDINTPLSDAKKMVNSLRPTLPQARKRLNESDLYASRAIRLSQAPTPYSRPPVTAALLLQSSRNANSGNMGPLPPIKELQVPSMSQLLQMKKMQNITEKARRITAQSTKQSNATTSTTTTTLSLSTEYDLPVLHQDGPQQQQQRRINKMKSKVIATQRSLKSIPDETAPAPPNLPNIQFPTMQSKPTFDIKLRTIAPPPTITTQPLSPTAAAKSTPFESNTKSLKCVMNTTTTTASTALREDFKFSAPLTIEENLITTQAQLIVPKDMNHYKFSTPTYMQQSFINSGCCSAVTMMPQLKNSSVLEALNNKSSTPTASSPNKIQKPTEQWECSACWVRNKAEVAKCAACETPRKGSFNQENVTAGNTVQAGSSTFGEQFKKGNGTWECDVCMIRNKPESTKCVACETQRPSMSTAASTSSSTLPTITGSFGDAFKPKANTWECKTCLIINKMAVNECVACQTKRPTGATSQTKTSASPCTTFKFGFAHTEAKKPTASTDAGFKALASQQINAKWECEACLTRNDAARKKCVCCEQLKPGLANSDVSQGGTKFMFGATAASKYSFGFKPTLGAGTEDNVKQESSPLSSTKSELGDKTQIHQQPAKNTSALQLDGGASNDHSKDTFDGDNKLQQQQQNELTTTNLTSSTVKESSPIKKMATITTTTTTPATLTFGFQKYADTAPTKAATTTTSAVLTTPSVKFSLPSTGYNMSSDTFAEKPTVTKASSSTPASDSRNGFNFINNQEQRLGENMFKSGTSVGLGFTINSDTAITTSKQPQETVNSTAAVSAVMPAATNALKPMFAAPTNPLSTTVTSSSNSIGVGGFSFGIPKATSTSTALNHLTTTAAAADVTFSSPTPASNTSNAPTTNLFSGIVSSTMSNPMLNTSTATFFTPQANKLQSTTTNNAMSSNLFGSFVGDNKSDTSALFGGANANNATATTTANFSFGIAAKASVVTSTSSASTSNATSTLTTVWPKNNFVFGKTATGANTATDAKPEPIGGSSVFAFGSAQNMNSGKSTSIFGAAQTPSTESSNPVFGNISSTSVSASSSSSNVLSKTQSNIFGSSAASTTGSIFGAAFPNNNVAAAPTPTFGNATFGSPSSSISSIPAFGSSTSSTSITFGGFGQVAPPIETKTSEVEAKKPNVSFTFGANAAAVAPSQNVNVGFNFGSATTNPTNVPAFNFGASGTGASQPTFNFTGTTSEKTENVVKPFQFGATLSTPCFNFTGGATEAAPSAPFQFNASPMPVTSNIFAPNPTPGAQSVQQTRRKIRPPVRRLTPR